METIGMVSLGCAKNQVNGEQMLSLLQEAGYPITPDPEEAEVLIINTCAFIESAKQEAIDNILDYASLKTSGKLRKLLVTGCLSQRYPEEILSELPEVDGILGTGSYDEIVPAVRAALRGEKPKLLGDVSGPLSEARRVLTTGPAWAYLKIAEGCDNHCSYCVIPSLRGRYRSRPLENLVLEARALSEVGVRELIVVAQDITRYGMDLYGEPRLPQLLRELAKLEGIHWIRLHYLYPDLITDELIDLVADEPKILKYLDIPIQHINDGILKRMNRRGTGAEIRALIRTLRERIPGLVLRTSLITGLPGEGEAEFEELCDFLRETRIERVGVFPFSPEEGTPAAEMTDRVDAETARARADRIMALQDGVMSDWYAAQIGKTLQVLCTGEEGGMLTGRSWADSPDIDGTVWFEGGCPAGEFAQVRITGLMDGELMGEQV